MIETVSLVPAPIINTLESLKPNKTINGSLINNEYDRSFFPPDFMNNLYWAYHNNYGHHPPFLIPKMYLLLYRLVLKIPTLKQSISVFSNDEELQKACCFSGYHKTGEYLKRIAVRQPSEHYNHIGLQGLLRIHTDLLELSKQYKEALHNLADELDYKKITIDGLVPSVWVECYRKPRIKTIKETIMSIQDFEAICASNTGIAVIDDLTRNLPLEIRSDIRQDSALRCFELGIDISAEDTIAAIVQQVTRKSRNNAIKQSYQQRSLFSKPFKDSDTELWQTIADPSADFIADIEDREILTYARQ